MMQNFDSINNRVDDDLRISQQDRLLIQKKGITESESSIDINDRDLKGTQETLKHSYKGKRIKYSKDYDMINNLKKGVYINELGEESLLSDSSFETNHLNLNITEEISHGFKRRVDYPKIIQRITKLSLPDKRSKKSKVQKVEQIDKQYNRMSK
jgi:hypothetical protein